MTNTDRRGYRQSRYEQGQTSQQDSCAQLENSEQQTTQQNLHRDHRFRAAHWPQQRIGCSVLYNPCGTLIMLERGKSTATVLAFRKSIFTTAFDRLKFQSNKQQSQDITLARMKERHGPREQFRVHQRRVELPLPSFTSYDLIPDNVSLSYSSCQLASLLVW
jgi:hypothetical protein